MIKCPFCEKEYKQLTNNHLTKKHSISLEEFKILYPSFEITSDKLRESLSKGASDRAKKGWQTYKQNKDVSLRMMPLYTQNNSNSKKEKLSNTMKKKWKDPNYREMMSKALSSSVKMKEHLTKIHIPKRKTSIEIKVENQLLKNNIAFEKQKIIRVENHNTFIIPDFYLPQYNLIIECYGDYWHCNPLKYPNGPINEQQILSVEKDKFKMDIYNQYNYNLLIIWELDINKDDFDILSHLKEYN